MTNTIVATGLVAAGYQCINLDDCWDVSRDALGIIQADLQAFPTGISALSDYVYSRKLKFGFYSAPLGIHRKKAALTSPNINFHSVMMLNITLKQ
ncbi:unnamed protein product [Adineta steineri]|uniref:Alpha-galactosidase n=1 Tax=Adineta steineri TaxID=433720 RepID=A0A818FXL5_9BILA|nr:unnamed protein product [Adineta steineri]CAF3505781.1 unnamed protein product [Adineta steineri]